MRFLIVLLLLLPPAASALSPRPALAQEAQRIVAVVNDQIISMRDLAARSRLIMMTSGLPDTPEVRQRTASRVLRNLIDERLQMQEARRLKVKVSEAEIAGAVAQLEKQNNLPSGGLERTLREGGVPMGTLIDQVEANLAWVKVLRRQVASQLQVGENEIDAYLERLKANAQLPRSLVAEIFLAVDDPREEDETRRLAERLGEQIRGGAGFQPVAREFSQSPTAANGGDLGWVVEGQLPEELETTLKRMQPGDLSPPIRGPAGYYVLYLRERRSNLSAPVQSAPPKPVVTDDTKVTLQQVFLPMPPDTPRNRLAEKAREAKALTAAARSCPDMEKVARKVSPDLSGALGELRLGDLPAELKPVVAALPVGQPSEPITRPDGVQVLMVCARSGGAPAAAPTPPPAAASTPPSLPDRNQVADILYRQKLDVQARRYLRDLRRAAFVDVRI